MDFMRRSSRALLIVALATLPLLLVAQARKPKETSALKHASEAFRAGTAARQAGNLELARTQFAKAARLAPQIPESHEALGAVLVELGKPADAVAELEAALKLKPADVGIETNLALAYAKAGQPAQAIPYFKAAFQALEQPGQRPVDAAFCEAYGWALVATAKPVDALDMLRTARERGADRPDLDDAIGALHAQLGHWDEARIEFEQALSKDSSMVLPRIHLGVLFREQHQNDAALKYLEGAIKLDPANALAQFEYGRTLEAAGQDEAAEPRLEEAVKLNPAQPGVQYELAMTLQRLGRQQEAIPYFQTALERDPHNSSILTNLGLALTLTGKAKEALDSFHRALAEDPKAAVIYKDLGVAHVQLSAFDEAIADFQAALKLDPNDSQLHYKFKDRLDDAIVELTKAGQLDPTLQDPPYTLGILLMQMGRLDEAVVELRKAVALRPLNGDAWAILGSTLKQDSRLEEAADALKKAIPLLPGQPGPRVTLAGVLADQASTLSSAADASEAAGDQQKASALRAQVKELRAQVVEYRREGAVLARSAVSRQRANFAMNAGNQLMLRGQIADAVARYQEAIAADSTFAEPHNQLAIAYERQGRAEEAAAERAKATSLAPAN